jgi:hypothetical protein
MIREAADLRSTDGVEKKNGSVITAGPGQQKATIRGKGQSANTAQLIVKPPSLRSGGRIPKVGRPASRRNKAPIRKECHRKRTIGILGIAPKPEHLFARSRIPKPCRAVPTTGKNREAVW